ncbi:MAG: hypothetical protein OK456_07515 [Thaumarchaeota archaeon]|nr:hypothetical protein [Nitrososphaerota archaeon]
MTVGGSDPDERKRRGVSGGFLDQRITRRKALSRTGRVIIAIGAVAVAAGGGVLAESSLSGHGVTTSTSIQSVPVTSTSVTDTATSTVATADSSTNSTSSTSSSEVSNAVRSVVFQTVLTDSNGNPIANEPVEFMWGISGGAFEYIGTFTTDTNGVATSSSVSVSIPNKIDAQSPFGGDATRGYGASTGTLTAFELVAETSPALIRLHG